MTPTWEDGTEPLVGGGLVQAGKVDRQVRAALAAAKEVQTGPSQNERLMRYADETREEFYKGIKEAIDPTPDIPKIGCVGHDCAACKAREAAQQGNIMNFAQAHKILTTITNGEFTDTSLHDVGVYLHATKDGATLDGKFDADDLEAIALWMRHPKEVAAAQPRPTDPRIAALEAKVRDYEAALRDTMQSLGDTMQSPAWLSFGQALGYSDVLLTAQGAMDKGRAALAKHGGAA